MVSTGEVAHAVGGIVDSARCSRSYLGMSNRGRRSALVLVGAVVGYATGSATEANSVLTPANDLDSELRIAKTLPILLDDRHSATLPKPSALALPPPAEDPRRVSR